MDRKHRVYRDCVKRALDVGLAGLALVALSPLLGITALLVRLRLGSPVVFRQARPGMGEKIFYLYKFRSMTNEMGEDGRLLPDALRLTKFGKFLRASSLDELLELVNIIRGDMSIVGPRPLSVYYLPHYSAQERRRHEVRPGLTGLAQVSGRNSLNWEERFALDLDYVEHVSFLGDLKIVLNTVRKVLKGADVSVRGTTKVKDFGPHRIIQEEGEKTIKRDGMTYSEIGSYFWLEDAPPKADGARLPDWLPRMSDAALTLSGRAAIDVALRDILKDRPVREALVPSYCCVSMLQPFTDRGIGLRFYSVDYRDGRFVYEINGDERCDVMLAMSYFGLDPGAERDLVKRLHDAGTVVIEDITHSLLREDSCSECCDYAVASLRKWFPVPAGGWVGKRAGALSVRPDADSDHAVEGKIRGMREKYAYLTGEIPDKEGFLSLQSKFDTDLIHIDRLLRMDGSSRAILAQTDVEAVRARRRRNAAALTEGLSDLAGARLELPRADWSKDAPLFLPIFLRTEERDALRACLVERGIYCPVHWPEVMGAPTGVRANELSLICDQRYAEGDMEAIIACIHEWAERSRPAKQM